MARGADIHPVYQRGIRWDQVSNLHFVWVKVSDGGAPYPGPDAHVLGAQAHRIPVGGYHYAQLSPGPEAQADVLLGEVARLGAKGVAPMLDLESPFVADTAAKDFAVAFCRRVAAKGYRPAVYMNASFAKNLRPDLWGIPGLVIVVARYGAKPEAPGASQYLGRYDVHQYTSSGTLSGSAGLVDFDESYNDDLLNAVTVEVPDMDKNQDQLLRELHVALFDNAAPSYPGAGYVSIRAAVTGLAKTVAELTALVRADSPATADQLAAALIPGLTPVVTAALKDVQGDDPAAFAKAVTDHLGDLLRASAPTA